MSLRRPPLDVAALLYLGLTSLFTGAWAQFLPESFFARYPGFSFWVAGDGAYNEHLIRDVGGLNLAVAVLSLIAFIFPRMASFRTLGWVYLVYGLPHLYYHLLHLHTLPTPADHVTSIGGLALAALAALWLAVKPDGYAPRTRDFVQGSAFSSSTKCKWLGK